MTDFFRFYHQDLDNFSRPIMNAPKPKKEEPKKDETPAQPAAEEHEATKDEGDVKMEDAAAPAN